MLSFQLPPANLPATCTVVFQLIASYAVDFPLPVLKVQEFRMLNFFLKIAFQNKQKFMIIYTNIWIFLISFIYFESKNENACVHKWGKGRERERIPRERICTDRAEPDTGLDLTNREIMTWAEIKSQVLNQLSHSGAPQICEFLFYLFHIYD